MIDELLTANQAEQELGEATDIADGTCLNGHIFFTDYSGPDFQPELQLAASQILNSYYVGIDQLISTRELVFDSLKACNARYDALVLDLDWENPAPAFAEPALDTCSWATTSALLTDESRTSLNESLLSPELAWTEIPGLMASSRSQVLWDLRSKIGRLRGLMKHLTVRIGVLIRPVGRPVFDHTFVGLQKSFHLLHGAHPPRRRAGLFSGRRSNLLGGCIQAISSIPV